MGAEMTKEGGSLNKNRGLSQEGLKLIACLTMLIDHIGATLVPMIRLRIIGRLAFPIYCFLLAEGMARTRDVKKYGVRLAIGAVLSEVPFDLLFFGGLTWAHQSVMITLLLGYLMMLWMWRYPGMRALAVFVCAGAAELLNTDYGAMGVLMIAVFALTANREDRLVLQVLGVAALCWLIGGVALRIGAVRIPLQLFGAAAMLPIWLYNGRKATRSKAVQWGFYLFYPVHLAVLLAVKLI